MTDRNSNLKILCLSKPSPGEASDLFFLEATAETITTKTFLKVGGESSMQMVLYFISHFDPKPYHLTYTFLLECATDVLPFSETSSAFAVSIYCLWSPDFHYRMVSSTSPGAGVKLSITVWTLANHHSPSLCPQ